MKARGQMSYEWVKVGSRKGDIFQKVIEI